MPVDSETAYKRVAAFLQRQGSPGILGDREAFDKRYTTEPRIRTIVQDINTVEQRIEQSRLSRNRLEQLIRHMFSGNKKIVFEDTGIDVKADEGQNIGLASLSSGEKQALWIFILSLLAGENTLLIDEPEISMHIDWQEALLSSMRELNPNAQIIVATHSPGIMSRIPDEKNFGL
jgi:predicted ATPase